MLSSLRLSGISVAAGALALLGVGTIAAIHPAAAASVIATIAANVSCSTGGTTACQTVTNTSSGIGFNGVSNTGLGLRGTSTGGIGMKGTTASATSYGVFGEAYPGSSSNKSGTGVGGQSSYGSGVSGVSTKGIGVYAFSSNGIGLAALSSDAEALYVSNIGVQGVPAAYIDVSAAAPGLVVQLGDNSVSNAIQVYTNAPPNGDTENESGNVLVGSTTSGPSTAQEQKDVVSIDGQGSEILAGSLTQSGNPLVRTATSSGVKVETFGNRGASPTLEDDGEATLVSGQAYVRLNPTFVSAIDTSAKYLAFVTPQGESKGLYVTAITPRGFAVRENAAGRSSLTFDYRVVAKPYDMKLMYMPAMSLFHDLGKSKPPFKKRLP